MKSRYRLRVQGLGSVAAVQVPIVLWLLAKKKNKLKKSKKTALAEGQDGSASQREEAAHLRTDSKHSRRAGKWESYRVPIISGIIVIALGSFLIPARSWVGGAFDEIHDFFLSFDAKRVDDLEERIDGRPFWQSEPSLQGDSLSFLKHDLSREEEPVAALEPGTTSARVITVDELVEQAAELDGKPIIVVGRFYSNTVLGGESLNLDREEVVLSGNNSYAYFAIGTGYSQITRGGYENLVAVLGVLVATGRVKEARAPAGVETAYFAVIEEIGVGPHNPDFRRAIRQLSGET